MDLLWSEPSYYDTITVDELIAQHVWLDNAMRLAKIRSKFEAEEGYREVLDDIYKSNKNDVIDEHKWR